VIMAPPAHVILYLLCVFSLFAFPQSALAWQANFAVDDTSDLVDANPCDQICQTQAQTCTLRAAVQQANALGGSNIITVPAGIYTLSITGAFEDNAARGDLDILADVTVRGAGARDTVIHGVEDRIFDVRPGANAVISGFAVAGGFIDGDGG